MHVVRNMHIFWITCGLFSHAKTNAGTDELHVGSRIRVSLGEPLDVSARRLLGRKVRICHSFGCRSEQRWELHLGDAHARRTWGLVKVIGR